MPVHRGIGCPQYDSTSTVIFLRALRCVTYTINIHHIKSSLTAALISSVSLLLAFCLFIPLPSSPSFYQLQATSHWKENFRKSRFQNNFRGPNSSGDYSCVPVLIRERGDPFVGNSQRVAQALIRREGGRRRESSGKGAGASCCRAVAMGSPGTPTHSRLAGTQLKIAGEQEGRGVRGTGKGGRVSRYSVQTKASNRENRGPPTPQPAAVCPSVCRIRTTPSLCRPSGAQKHARTHLK